MARREGNRKDRYGVRNRGKELDRGGDGNGDRIVAIRSCALVMKELRGIVFCRRGKNRRIISEIIYGRGINAKFKDQWGVVG